MAGEFARQPATEIGTFVTDCSAQITEIPVLLKAAEGRPVSLGLVDQRLAKDFTAECRRLRKTTC